MEIRHENIVYTQTMKIFSQEVRPIAHWHQRAEFMYVLVGQCRIRIGSLERLCVPGDLAVIRSGQIHSLQSPPGCRLYVSTFDPTLLYHFFPELRFPRSFITAQEQAGAGLAEEIARLLGSIYTESSKHEDLYETLMRADILRLYSLLVRHFEEAECRNEQTLVRLQLFQSALEFIADHYAENLSLGDVAQAINYNPTYVSTLFVSCAGVNFKTYLDNFRIKKAVDLLRASRLTVAQVAAQCGCENIRTFNNTFRRVTGQTPSEIRRSTV